MIAGALCGLCLCISVLFASTLKAQDNYPLPAGEPDTWKTPGEEEKLVVEPAPRTASPDTLPSQQDYREQNMATRPGGEPEEEYTGTKDFGGIGGTGITEFGTERRR